MTKYKMYDKHRLKTIVDLISKWLKCSWTKNERFDAGRAGIDLRSFGTYGIPIAPTRI